MTKEEQARKPITDAEIEATLKIPAVHINKFYLTDVGTGMRLAFAEGIGPKFAPVIRDAVYFSYDDAIALRDLFIQVLPDVVAGKEEQNKREVPDQ